MALLDCEIKVINFAVCWKNLTFIGTLYSENSINFVQSAGNLSEVINLPSWMTSAFVCFNKGTKAFFNSSAKAFTEDGQDKKADERTSETTRVTSFDFKSYRDLTGLTTDQVSDDWLTWFIGFSEGDGAILTGPKNNNPRFVLTQKELAVLNHIHETLGIGRIKTYGPYSRFIVSDKKVLWF